MSNILGMQIVQTQHDLVYYVGSISFREFLYFCQSSEELATFHQFWDDVIIFIVFDKFNYSYYIRVAIVKQQIEFIFQQILIYLVFQYFLFCYYLHREFGAAVEVAADTDNSVCSLT